MAPRPCHSGVALELDSTFYEEGSAHDYWNNPDCAGYQPNFKVSWNAPTWASTFVT